MSKATSVVELDLLGLHPRPAAAASSFRRNSSFREIQCAIARMDPAVVKSVIASGSPGSKPAAAAAAAAAGRSGARVEAGDDPATSPLTIFYNGTVSVFDLTHDKAKYILKVAAEASNGGISEASQEKVAAADNECLNGVVSENGRCWLVRRATNREEEVAAAIPREAQGKVDHLNNHVCP